MIDWQLVVENTFDNFVFTVDQPLVPSDQRITNPPQDMFVPGMKYKKGQRIENQNQWILNRVVKAKRLFRGKRLKG